MMAYARGNKLQLKWDRDTFLEIIIDCYNEVCNNKDMILKREVQAYASNKHGICVSSFNRVLKEEVSDDEEIMNLKELIDIELESRVIKAKNLTNQVQVLLLKNKHEYSDRREVDNNMNINGAKIVLEFPKDMELKKKEDDGKAGQQESGHSKDKA